MSALTSPTGQTENGQQLPPCGSSSLDYILNGCRHKVDPKKLSLEGWFALIKEVLALYKPHLQYFEFQPPTKCLQLTFISRFVDSFMLEPGSEVFNCSGITLGYDHLRVFALCNLLTEADLPEAVKKVTRTVNNGGIVPERPGSQYITVQKFLLVGQDGKWLVLYRTIVRWIDSAPASRKPEERIVGFYVVQISDTQLLEVFKQCEAEGSGSCANLARTIIFSLEQHAEMAIRFREERINEIKGKIRLAGEITSRIS